MWAWLDFMTHPWVIDNFEILYKYNLKVASSVVHINYGFVECDLDDNALGHDTALGHGQMWKMLS